MISDEDVEKLKKDTRHAIKYKEFSIKLAEKLLDFVDRLHRERNEAQVGWAENQNLVKVYTEIARKQRIELQRRKNETT